PRLSEYVKNIEKCTKLVNAFGVTEFNNFAFFDEFCYWYDYFYQAENGDEEDDIGYELTEKTKMPEIDFEEFFTKLNLDTASRFEEHSLRNPERTKIMEIIRECSAGRWGLPNFQRY